MGSQLHSSKDINFYSHEMRSDGNTFWEMTSLGDIVIVRTS